MLETINNQQKMIYRAGDEPSLRGEVVYLTGRSGNVEQCPAHRHQGMAMAVKVYGVASGATCSLSH